jgi:ribonuclease BN (tRNA processing enzyme)
MRTVEDGLTTDSDGEQPVLTVLGGGGWFPGHGRHTACALLRHGGAAIMIDAGTGVARFIERPELLDGTTRLDIVLTHFHLDHIVGLAYLPALGLCEQTTIWGPGSLLYGTTTAELLAHVSRQPFHPVPLEQQDIAVRDLAAGATDLGGVTLTTRRQDRHSAPSLGLRFDDALTWITDTAYDPGSAPFAEGSALLAHEAWFTEDAPRNAQIHASARQAAQVAEQASVARLVLIHLPPFKAALDSLLAEAQATAPEAVAAGEGASFAPLSV